LHYFPDLIVHIHDSVTTLLRVEIYILIYKLDLVLLAYFSHELSNEIFFLNLYLIVLGVVLLISHLAFDIFKNEIKSN